MLFRKHEHNIPEKRYPHTEGDFSLAGLSFREKIRKMRQDPRGIEVGQLIWIVVGVLAATAIGVFIFNQVTDTGSTIEEAGSSDTVIYNQNCDVATINPVARITGNGTYVDDGTADYVWYNLSRVISETGSNAEFQRSNPTAEQVRTSDLDISTLRIYEDQATIPGDQAAVSILLANLGANFPLPTSGDATNAATEFGVDNTPANTLTLSQAEWRTTPIDGQLRSAVIAVNRADGCWRLTT